MPGSDLKSPPKQSSHNDGEPPSKRARLEGGPVMFGSEDRTRALPSSKLDGNTLLVPGSDVEDDPYSLDATASVYEHKASDLYLDTVCQHASSTPDTPSLFFAD